MPVKLFRGQLVERHWSRDRFRTPTELSSLPENIVFMNPDWCELLARKAACFHTGSKQKHLQLLKSNSGSCRFLSRIIDLPPLWNKHANVLRHQHGRVSEGIQKQSVWKRSDTEASTRVETDWCVTDRLHVMLIWQDGHIFHQSCPSNTVWQDQELSEPRWTGSNTEITAVINQVFQAFLRFLLQEKVQEEDL